MGTRRPPPACSGSIERPSTASSTCTASALPSRPHPKLCPVDHSRAGRRRAFRNATIVAECNAARSLLTPRKPGNHRNDATTAPGRTWHAVRRDAIRDGSKRRAGAVRAGGSAMLMTGTTSMKEDGKYMIATASRPGAGVLAVEDDEEMRPLVAELLTEQGYRVTAEPDTLSGLIHLLSDGADVLVVDWKMPDLDGLELLGTVRRCFPDVPVVFVSAFATPELYYRAMQEGAF